MKPLTIQKTYDPSFSIICVHLNVKNVYMYMIYWGYGGLYMIFMGILHFDQYFVMVMGFIQPTFKIFDIYIHVGA